MKDMSTALTSNGVTRRGPAATHTHQSVSPKPASSSQQLLLHESKSTGACTSARTYLSLPALLSALAGVAVYLNTLQNDFCFDDSSAILTNPDLLPKTPWTDLFLNDFWGTPMHQEGSHKSYRPLCVLTFRLNYMLHGLDPLGYHLVNVLLHGIVCYIFVIVSSIVVFKDAKRKRFPLLVAGLSFAVHPVHTEAVSMSLLIIYCNIIKESVYHERSVYHKRSVYVAHQINQLPKNLQLLVKMLLHEIINI